MLGMGHRGWIAFRTEKDFIGGHRLKHFTSLYPSNDTKFKSNKMPFSSLILLRIEVNHIIKNDGTRSPFLPCSGGSRFKRVKEADHLLSNANLLYRVSSWTVGIVFLVMSGRDAWLWKMIMKYRKGMKPKDVFVTFIDVFSNLKIYIRPADLS